MRAGRSLRLWRVAAPLAVGVVFLCVWEIVVQSFVNDYMVPGATKSTAPEPNAA